MYGFPAKRRQYIIFLHYTDNHWSVKVIMYWCLLCFIAGLLPCQFSHAIFKGVRQWLWKVEGNERDSLHNICIYVICIYVCIMCIDLYTLFVCVCMHIYYVCMHVDVYMYVCRSICVCVYVYMYVCKSMYIYICILKINSRNLVSTMLCVMILTVHWMHCV